MPKKEPKAEPGNETPSEGSESTQELMWNGKIHDIYNLFTELEEYAREFVAKELGKDKDQVTEEEVLNFGYDDNLPPEAQDKLRKAKTYGRLPEEKKKPWMVIIDKILNKFEELKKSDPERFGKLEKEYFERGYVHNLYHVVHGIETMKPFIERGLFNTGQLVINTHSLKEDLRSLDPGLPGTDTFGIARERKKSET